MEKIPLSEYQINTDITLWTVYYVFIKRVLCKSPQKIIRRMAYKAKKAHDIVLDGLGLSDFSL